MITKYWEGVGVIEKVSIGGIFLIWSVSKQQTGGFYETDFIKLTELTLVLS